MKNIRPKTNLLISNIIVGIGAACAAVEIIVFDVMLGFNNQNNPLLLILAFSFFIAGIAYRFITVKCPHCGDKLMGSKKIPDKCPACGQDLNKLPHEIPQEEPAEAATETEAE